MKNKKELKTIIKTIQHEMATTDNGHRWLFLRSTLPYYLEKEKELKKECELNAYGICICKCHCGLGDCGFKHTSLCPDCQPTQEPKENDWEESIRELINEIKKSLEWVLGIKET